jgi:ketosteroid isomerase-like protein
MFGTQLDGGEFENLFVAVTIVGSGRIQRHELFEIEDLDQAFARFEELRPDSTPLVPPNVATRMSERVEELRRHHDWRALRALAADGFVYEDRRPGNHLAGSVDMFIESDRFVMGRADLCIERELLVTAGDRIRLEHIVFRAERADDFQIELLSLLEIDAAGRLAAVIAFDPGDRRAAYVETQTRFIAGEGAEYAAALAPFRAFSEATTARDWAAARWVLSDDFEAVDHGSLSLWGTQDADDFIASLQVLDDVASETGAEACRTVAWDHHGRVVVLRRDGTVQDGGPFESVTVVLETTRDGRMTRHEMFDIEDLDRALARFAELRPA